MILRDGSSAPLQLKISRDIIHIKSPQETAR
jgi:hypothetical protein